MVWLFILSTLIFIGYTQLAIHLPSDTSNLYRGNHAFSTVFSEMPRQFISFMISTLTGMLLNDFLISRLKIITHGQYLWARILFSTMIGEAVLNIIGLIIGFWDIMDFKTQMLPNMLLSYSYKLLWNAALIPVIYLITNFLKKSEGIDVYDYDVNYNPFIIY